MVNTKKRLRYSSRCKRSHYQKVQSHFQFPIQYRQNGGMVVPQSIVVFFCRKEKYNLSIVLNRSRNMDSFVLSGNSMKTGPPLSFPKIEIIKTEKEKKVNAMRKNSREVSVTKKLMSPEISPRLDASQLIHSSRSVAVETMNNDSVQRDAKFVSKCNVGGIAMSKCSRAKEWSPIVENLFRFQQAGFKHLEEYLTVHCEPEYWNETGFVRCLQASKTGFFLYFRSHRECNQRHLHCVKIYS